MTPPAYPSPGNLRRVTPWQTRPPYPPDAARRMTAIHEAGHVVLMRWVGLPSPGASIHTKGDTVTGGEACWPERAFFAQLPKPAPDPAGELAAAAASVFHAGVIAEGIELGQPWSCPIFYPEASDYQRADDMLADSFGRHCSGAHAYAQQVARHVLVANWASVLQIAHQLEQTGRWQPIS